MRLPPWHSQMVINGDEQNVGIRGTLQPPADVGMAPEMLLKCWHQKPWKDWPLKHVNVNVNVNNLHVIE